MKFLPDFINSVNAAKLLLALSELFSWNYRPPTVPIGTQILDQSLTKITYPYFNSNFREYRLVAAIRTMYPDGWRKSLKLRTVVSQRFFIEFKSLLKTDLKSDFLNSELNELRAILGDVGLTLNMSAEEISRFEANPNDHIFRKVEALGPISEALHDELMDTGAVTVLGVIKLLASGEIRSYRGFNTGLEEEAKLIIDSFLRDPLKGTEREANSILRIPPNCRTSLKIK